MNTADFWYLLGVSLHQHLLHYLKGDNKVNIRSPFVALISFCYHLEPKY